MYHNFVKFLGGEALFGISRAGIIPSTYATNFAYKIEFYSQFILVSDTQSTTAGKAVKNLGLETC